MKKLLFIPCLFLVSIVGYHQQYPPQQYANEQSQQQYDPYNNGPAPSKVTYVSVNINAGSFWGGFKKYLGAFLGVYFGVVTLLLITYGGWVLWKDNQEYFPHDLAPFIQDMKKLAKNLTAQEGH